MGIFTLLYESSRKDNISLLIIAVLFFGICGVIFTKESKSSLSVHTFFGLICFFSILFFIIYHSFKNNDNRILSFFMVIHILISFYLLDRFIFFWNKNEKDDYSIFLAEFLLIFNFGLFYLYLHK